MTRNDAPQAKEGRFEVAAPARPRFSQRDIAAIRRSRRQPRRRDYLYLHLRTLVTDLEAALADVHARDVLDVYCGVRPYEDLLPPGSRCVGLDVDEAFGAADVVSTDFLPFESGSFDLVLCTQAFYFLPRPEAAVAELARVLRGDGVVILTCPVVYPGTERLYSETQLHELFAGWRDVSTVTSGGTAVSRATLTGYLLHQFEKRLSGPAKLLRPAFPVAYVFVNLVGSSLDVLERRYLGSADRLPANILLKATRPAI